MKSKIKILVLACLFLGFTAAHCKKDKDPVSQLPPETQEGKNTFGCLVNGQVFLPKGNGGLSPILTCYYQSIYPSVSGFVFQVNANDNRTSDNLKSITINLDSFKLNSGMSILLNSGHNGISGKGQRVSGNVLIPYRYNTSDGVTGMLDITMFDEINQIVSGTFWFNAVNSFGDSVHITQGRFDMKYTR